MGIRTDLRTLLARLLSSCGDEDTHIKSRGRIIIGTPYDFKHVSGPPLSLSTTIPSSPPSLSSSTSSSPSTSPSDSSSPSSAFSSSTFASSTCSKRSNIFTSSTRSGASSATYEKPDPIPTPIPSIKRKDVAGARIPTNTGIEAFLMGRRMGLGEGKGDGKSRNVTPESHVLVDLVEGEGASVRDAQKVEERDEKGSDMVSASDDTRPVTAAAASAARPDTNTTPDVDGRVSHDNELIDIRNSEEKLNITDEDQVRAGLEEYEDEDENTYDEEYEEDESDDEHDIEHNGILLLLEEEESEVVTATAVSMKRFGSTDMLSEIRSE